MSKQLHFCFHGAGGLGSVIGGFLARGGHKVTLIARKPHVEAMRALEASLIAPDIARTPDLGGNGTTAGFAEAVRTKLLGF